MGALAQASRVFPDEPSEHEPDLPDPGAEAEDVEFDVTSGQDLVDRLPDEAEIDRELKETFWTVVVLLDVAGIAIALGLLLAYFWGWTSRGGLLVAIGLVAGVGAAVRIRRFQRS